MRAFFKTIGVELPDFGLKVSFVDDMKAAIIDAKAFFKNTVNQISNMVLIDGDVFKRVQEGVDKLLRGTFPTKWLNLIDCENVTCFTDILNVDYIDGVIPGVAINGVNYTVDSDLVDAVQNVVADLGDVYGLVSDLLDGEIACKEYKSFQVDYAEIVANTFGKTAAELGVPNCPSTWQMCVDIEMANLEDFQSAMTQKLEDWGLIGPGGRRLQDECTLPGGVSIPLKLPSKLSDLMFQVVRDKSRNVLSEKQKSQAKQAETRAKQYVETMQGRVVSWVSKYWNKIPGVASLPVLEKKLKDKKPAQMEFSMSKEAMSAVASASIVIGCSEGNIVAKLQVLPFLAVAFDVNFLGWFQTSLGKKHFKASAASTLTAQSRALLKANEYACVLDAIEGTLLVAESDEYGPRWTSFEPKIVEFRATLDSTGISTEIVDRWNKGRKEWRLGIAKKLENDAVSSADPELTNHEDFESAHQSAMELRAKMHEAWEGVHPKFREEVTLANQNLFPAVDFEADDCAGPEAEPTNIRDLTKDDLKEYALEFLDEFQFNPGDVTAVIGGGGVVPDISLTRTTIDANGGTEETTLSIQYGLFNHLRCLALGTASEFDTAEVSFDVMQWFNFFNGIRQSFTPNAQLPADSATSLFDAAEASTEATESAQLAQKLSFTTEWSFGFLTIDFRKTEENGCTSDGDCCFGETFCVGLGLSLDGFEELSCQDEEDEGEGF